MPTLSGWPALKIADIAAIADTARHRERLQACEFQIGFAVDRQIET
jgi:hypothetical protein